MNRLTREIPSMGIMKESIMIAVLILMPQYCLANQEIKPILSPDDLVLTSADVWHDLSQLPDSDQRLLKLLYVRGFVDAANLIQAYAKPGTEGLFSSSKGVFVHDLPQEIDDFYIKYPKYKNSSPAFVMVGYLPFVRKGLPIESLHLVAKSYNDLSQNTDQSNT